MKVDQGKDEATVRFGNYTATVTAADTGWGKRAPRTEFKPGYLAEFEIKEVDKKAHHLKVELVQVPAVQGSMMTLNAKTGEIITMIGGYDFLTNKFNNAFQAYRQTGSAFKPFIYTAAIEWGMTPDTTVSGAAININGWQPHNYDGSTSCGDLPLKTALAHSMNKFKPAPRWCDDSVSKCRWLPIFHPLSERPKFRLIRWFRPTLLFPTRVCGSSRTWFGACWIATVRSWKNGKRPPTKWSVST